MTLFDWLLIGILVVSVLLGLWRGAVYEVLSLLGWPIAFFLSKYVAPEVANYLPMSNETGRSALAYGLVFVAAMLLWAMLVWLFSKLITAAGLGFLDGLMGGVFGVLRAALVVMLLVCGAGMTDLPNHAFWQQAQWSATCEAVAIRTQVFLPNNVAQRIHFPPRA
ncbi:MAG: hypothetical protein RL358_317 [Pseudomonadota bacterium]|jgi:membrane protein required for colicin V production